MVFLDMAHLEQRKLSQMNVMIPGKPVCDSLTGSQLSEFVFTREKAVFLLWILRLVVVRCQFCYAASCKEMTVTRGQDNNRELWSCILSAEWICFLCRSKWVMASPCMQEEAASKPHKAYIRSFCGGCRKLLIKSPYLSWKLAIW